MPRNGLTRSAVIWLAISSGCEPGAIPPAGVVTADSAGVTVIENTAPVWSEDAAWRIDPVPIVDIGGDDSAILLERVADVAFVAGGGFMVADEGQSEIISFSADGEMLWRTGRSGDGPGEYRLIGSAGAGPGDSIWVFDFGLRRFTILDAAGTPVRVADIGAAISAPNAAGRLDDGAFIIRELWGSRDARPAGPGLVRDPAAIVRVAPDGAGADTIAVYPGREFWFTVEDGRGVMNMPLYSHNTAAAARGDRVLIGDPATFAIDVFDGTGTKVSSIRIAGPNPDFDPEITERAISALLEPLPESERPASRAFLENMPGPASKPAFGRILIAQTGEIWVSEYVPYALNAAVWHVFDVAGRWLGTIGMPARFTLESVAADRVAGVWLDELDVEHVRVHRLIRPG